MSNLEERLHEALAAQAEAVSARADAWQENERRVQRDRVVRWRAPVSVAAVFAILLGGFGAAKAFDRPSTVHAASAGDGLSPASGTDIGPGDCVTSGTVSSAIFDGMDMSWQVSFFPDLDAGLSAPLCFALTVERVGQPADVVRGRLLSAGGGDGPAVAFDYLDVVEAGGVSWVIGGIDYAAAPRIGVIYSDGSRGEGLVIGAGRTWAFLLRGSSAPGDGLRPVDDSQPTPTHLIAYDYRGAVLQDVDLAQRFGPGWWSR